MARELRAAFDEIPKTGTAVAQAARVAVVVRQRLVRDGRGPAASARAWRHRAAAGANTSVRQVQRGARLLASASPPSRLARRRGARAPAANSTPTSGGASGDGDEEKADRPLLQESAHEFSCMARAGRARAPLARSASTDAAMRSIRAEFGGLRAFVRCALLAAEDGAEVPPVWSTIRRFQSELAARTRAHACAERAPAQTGCERGALFLATDAPPLARAAQASFAPRVVTASGAGTAVLHMSTPTSLLTNSHARLHALRAQLAELCTASAANSLDANCALQLATMRSLVDWFLIPLSDTVFTLAAHWGSSFSTTAMARSMLLRSHFEYFDALPKLLCAERARCALRRSETQARAGDAHRLALCEELVAHAARAPAGGSIL